MGNVELNERVFKRKLDPKFLKFMPITIKSSFKKHFLHIFRRLPKVEYWVSFSKII